MEPEPEERACTGLELTQPNAFGQWRVVVPIPASFDNNPETQTESTYPVIFSRANHCAFGYKSSVYFFGGVEVSTANNQPIDEAAAAKRRESLWASFHKFNTSSKEFSTQPIISQNAALFMGASSFGWLLQGNILFIFGGVNAHTGQFRHPEMASINVESGTIKRYESKTSISSIPSPRKNPLLACIEKSMLLLIGGEVYNSQTQSFAYINDMYTFKIETKTWTRIEDGFHCRVPILVRPSLVGFVDNNFFLFGGKREVLDDDGFTCKYIDNHQMYRFKIITKTANNKADCAVKQVFATNPYPQTQQLFDTIKYGERGIYAITTSLQGSRRRPHFWFFDHSTLVWSEVRQIEGEITEQIECKESDSFAVGLEKILKVEQNRQILEFSYSQTVLDSVLRETYHNSHLHCLCSLCKQQMQQNLASRGEIPAEQFLKYCSPLRFPFSAIGLLVDNATLASAKTCMIYFNVGQLGKQGASENSRVKYMWLQDNGLPAAIWGNELKPSDFADMIGNLYCTNAPEEMMAQQDNLAAIARGLKQVDQKEKALQKQYTQFLKTLSKNNLPSQPPAFSLNYHYKSEKDFEKEQHELIEKRQRLQHKKKTLETASRCKKFSNNLKLAGLSLGDTVIYACKQKKGDETLETPAQSALSQKEKEKEKEKDKEKQKQKQKQKEVQIRRYFFIRKEKNTTTNREYFTFYAYVTQNGNAIDPKMQSAIKFISKEYKKQLRLINERLKTMNNVTLISDMRNVEESLEGDRYYLALRKKQNDVYFGDASALSSLESKNIAKLNECVDISLKAYLGLLYLGKEQFNLFLSVKDHAPEAVSSQPFLPNIDRMLSTRKIVEVSKSLEFGEECSVVEIYWNPEPASPSLETQISSQGFVINGVLIYHKGRLVSRYEIDLGRIIDEFELRPNYGALFGYLEIKPEFGSNLYATDLFFPRAFEKYFARLRFVREYMEQKYRQRRMRPRNAEEAASYQKISKRARND